MTSCLPIGIAELLSRDRVEAPRVELKASWNEGPTAQQVLRTICGFANDIYNVNGGYIVIGVEAIDGVAQLPPRGLDPTQIEAAQRWIRGNCARLQPEYQPILSPETLNERHLLVVWVPASPIRPHSAPGERAGERRFWVRLGADTVEARNSVLTQLMQLTTWTPFDDQRAAEFSVHDLRSTLVREFLREVGSSLADEPDDLVVYRALRLISPINSHEVPRNVALLFFSDEPDRIFPGARIDVVLFRDGAGGDILEERIFRGPLHRQIRDCMSYLRTINGHHIRKHPDRPEASTWETVPTAAIEEALVNAVHHRDYQRCFDPTKVYIYPEALELTSYPGPMQGLKPEDFQGGHRVPQVSARNRRIGELLKELRLAEARSTGVAKIFRAMSSNGSPKPQFHFDEERTYFTVVLPTRAGIGLGLADTSEAPGEKATSYEVDYRSALQRNLDYLEIFGIDLPPESRSQKLSVAYVSLNLERRSGGAQESLPAEALFDRFSTDNGRILIRGDAGTGKSTLLRWAAMQAAAGSQGPVARFHGAPSHWRTRVPFLIRLRQCKGGSLPTPDDFPEFVATSLGHPPAEWVKSVLKEGRALLLLDGVDEIPNAHRETTRRGIADLVEQYPGTFYVVSTRPRAVDHDWLGTLGFREARISPMSELDRATFIDRWHEAVAEELKSRGKGATGFRDIAESLKRELAGNPEVARLATNPLLCAMICALYRDRRQNLPERQRQLCEDLCHALLHRRERESGLSLQDFPEPYRRLDYPQKRAAVQELAHHMVLNEYSAVPTEEAQRQIGKALKQFPGHSAADANVVADSLVERSGILREETPGEISFIHNTFKELLAGDYFAGEDAAGLLANHALDSAWQPVILFAVATERRGFATKVIRKMLERGSRIAKANPRARQLMALRCRAAALYIEEELDLQLQQLTATLFPPRNMEDAEVLASSGNTAVPFLVSSGKLRPNEAAACIRALRLIGTAQARQALRSFQRDRRPIVVSELSRAVNPLEIEWIQERLLAGERLPQGIAAQISVLSPLLAPSNLQTLDFSGTQIADLSPLAALTSLETLNLSGTQITDLSPLAALINLQTLDLSGTQITDLSPLAGLFKLKRLDVSGTQVVEGDLDLLQHLDCRIVL
jgi:predicted HTH transcriptional regulator